MKSKTEEKSIDQIIHDLRTPLATIVGFSEMILRKFDKKQVLKREWIEYIVEESKRLERIIDQDLANPTRQ